MTPPRLNMPCLIQPLDKRYAHVEATETDAGLDLHAGLFGPDDALDKEPPDYQYWGRLSLEGWQTLVEMFAFFHPERFARVLDKLPHSPWVVPHPALPHVVGTATWRSTDDPRP